LKQFFARAATEWKLVLLPALLKWGILGVGAVAVLDSSSIPVPMDAILAIYIWNDKGHFWLYCLMASAGSALGGLLPYWLGRVGGELFLRKRVTSAKYERMRDRFQRQEFLAVLIPSMMPPPAPWKMFVFASGVFQMRIANFLTAVFVGRMLRWLVLSLLVLKLGPSAVNLVAQHAVATVVVVLLLAVGGFALWWRRKKRKGELPAD
jgi:membrane protein YqaA with SNARE-associated domain